MKAIGAEAAFFFLFFGGFSARIQWIFSNQAGPVWAKPEQAKAWRVGRPGAAD